MRILACRYKRDIKVLSIALVLFRDAAVGLHRFASTCENVLIGPISRGRMRLAAHWRLWQDAAAVGARSHHSRQVARRRPRLIGTARGRCEGTRSEEHTSELQSRPHLV